MRSCCILQSSCPRNGAPSHPLSAERLRSASNAMKSSCKLPLLLQTTACRQSSFTPSAWLAAHQPAPMVLVVALKEPIGSERTCWYAGMLLRPRMTTMILQMTHGVCGRVKLTPTQRLSQLGQIPSTWMRTRRRCSQKRALALRTPGVATRP